MHSCTDAQVADLEEKDGVGLRIRHGIACLVHTLTIEGGAAPIAGVRQAFLQHDVETDTSWLVPSSVFVLRPLNPPLTAKIAVLWAMRRGTPSRMLIQGSE